MNTQTYLFGKQRIELTAAEVLAIAQQASDFSDLRAKYPLKVAVAARATTIVRDGNEYHMAEGMPTNAITDEIEKLISA